jgi:competence protein ComGC
MDQLKQKKGFTLLEMTIVVIIISVLFLLTVPNIQKTLTIVNNKGCKAIEKVGDAAILQYKLAYDEYPTSVGDLINAGLLTEEQTVCDGSKRLIISDGQAYIE